MDVIGAEGEVVPVTLVTPPARARAAEHRGIEGVDREDHHEERVARSVGDTGSLDARAVLVVPVKIAKAARTRAVCGEGRCQVAFAT